MRRCVWLLATIFILDTVINLFKIFSNGHGSVQCLIEYIMVLLEVHLYHFPISVHYMVDQIYLLDSHQLYVFVAELFDVSIFNVFNYLVLEGLVYGLQHFRKFGVLHRMYRWTVGGDRLWNL